MRISITRGILMDIIAVTAVICAFLVKGMSGFANTLVFNTIMSFTTSSVHITPVELLVGYPSNLFIVWKERKGISLKVCIPLSILVLIGIIPGVLFLLNGDTGLIKLLFGLIVVLLGVEMLLREKQKRTQKSSRLALLVIGILSGILCGLFGVGALLVAYISRTTKNLTQFRGNLCFVFFIENTFRIILYSMVGILNITILKSSLELLPFMAVGLAAGIFLSKKISERMTKKVIILLLILSGVSLIISNI
jgi:uncharacterized membrane protein YfcA